MEFIGIVVLVVVVVAMICAYELKVNADSDSAAQVSDGAASTADTVVLENSSGGTQGKAKWGDALSDASDMLSGLEDSDAELAEPKAIRTSGVVAAKKKTAAKKKAAKKKAAKKKAAKKKAPAKKKAVKKPAAKKKSPTKKKAAAKKKPAAKKK